MYSALYYPHTTVQSASLLRTALLMWDELHFIVPWEKYSRAMPAIEREAWEIIGHPRVPTDAEKAEAHELVKDFVSRPLPAAFRYKDDTADNYELYPQKFMGETWSLLADRHLVGAPLLNAERPTAAATGLSLMSILADCCAGETLARVTDQQAAYAFLSDAVVDRDAQVGLEAARDRLVAVPFEVADVEQISLDRLIALRKREAKSAGSAGLTQLRHRLVDRVEEQATSLASAKSEQDRKERTRLFALDLAEDLRDLREALQLEATQVLGSKQIIVSLLGAVGAIGSLFAVAPMEALAAGSGVGIAATAVTIGGLLSTKAKFAQTRKKILKEHPSAYLYEAFSRPLRL